MSVTASEVSPLNCRWITWNGSLPVCTRPPEPPHRVSETECAVCEFCNEDAPVATHTIPAPARPKPAKQIGRAHV